MRRFHFGLIPLSLDLCLASVTKALYNPIPFQRAMIQGVFAAAVHASKSSLSPFPFLFLKKGQTHDEPSVATD